jgi:hypothetical protein
LAVQYHPHVSTAVVSKVLARSRMTRLYCRATESGLDQVRWPATTSRNRLRYPRHPGLLICSSLGATRRHDSGFRVMSSVRTLRRRPRVLSLSHQSINFGLTRARLCDDCHGNEVELEELSG